MVIFGGRVVEEMPASVADEPNLLRAAYGLPPGSMTPEEVVAEAIAEEAAAPRETAEEVTTATGGRA